MSDTRTPADQAWVAQWLESQRQLLDRWRAAATGASASPDAGSPPASFATLATMFQAAAQGLSTQASLPRLPEFDGIPLGYFREHQLRLQRLQRATDEYDRLLKAMASAVAQVQSAAMDQLGTRKQAANDSGQPLDSFRKVYDQWVESGEGAFAQIAHDESFIRLQGELGNALTELKASQQALLEQWLKYFDLPTRAELNTVHKRMRELQQRLAQLETRAPKDDAAQESSPNARKRKASSKAARN